MDWLSLPLTLVLGAQVPNQPPAGRLPMLPLTQIDERALAADLDARTFTLTFTRPVPVTDLLLQLVRGTSLSVVPDSSVGGTFIGELKNVTVRRALDLILHPLELDFAVDGNLIRVFRRELATRRYDMNYLVTQRAGESRVGRQPSGADDGYARVTSTTRTDVFGDIAKGVRTLLSDRGTFNVDPKAGLVQVTDDPERLDRVGDYLDAVQDRIQRQVQIDARIVEIELSGEREQIDWDAIDRLTSLDQVLSALGAQGRVSIVASPRLVVLNNEAAIVRTEGLTLSVTPQIAPDAVITLSVTPIVSAPQGTQADTVARVADGKTMVFGGGSFGRSSAATRSGAVSRKRVELVVLLTPRVV